MSGSRKRTALRGRGKACSLLVLALVTALALSAAGRAATTSAADADAALEDALRLFAPSQARSLFGNAPRPDGRDATLLLRDLAAGLPSLSPERRALAEPILARPTDRNDALKPYRSKARHVCDARICFWWVTQGADAPPLADRNGNRIPDWVERTRAVFRKVWATEVGAFGYRRPLSDLSSRNHGPNGKLDVYLADIGVHGIYGYCTSDDPRRTRSRTVSSYCVVDDDFSRRQFGASGGRKALEVTAAHEFFHAVQFAYDWLEDRWFMEGTAAWIEDEVYPAINDNLQYLRASPIGRDLFWLPLDIWEPAASKPESGFIYGTWIFWRYLDERFGRAVVRDVWSRARSGTPAIGAVSGALAARGTSFATVFSAFGAANLTPASSYADGALYVRRPNVGPVPSGTFALTAATPAVSPAPIQMPHMSNDYYSFVPGAGLLPTSTVTVEVALPGNGGAANLAVRRADGSSTTVPVPLSAGGVGTVSGVEFGLGTVSSVTLVLTNAGTRFTRCNEDFSPPFFTCGGFSLDDADYTIRATANP